MASPMISSFDPGSKRNRFRRQRFRHVLGLIDAIIERNGVCRILDIGGEEAYWLAVGDLLQDRPIQVDMLNLAAREPVDDRFRVLVGDACHMPEIGDKTYDLAHANSVIEHVGGWRRMRSFASEVRRVAWSYYVQAPYLWFPYEPHYRAIGFQYLPEPVRARMLYTRKHGYSRAPGNWDVSWDDVEDVRLPDKTMFRLLFPDAALREERFLGVTKSLMAMRGPSVGH